MTGAAWAKGPDIVRPDIVPLKSSVLDHALAAGNVDDISHFGLVNNDGLWSSFNGLGVHDTTVPASGTEGNTATKTFDTAPWQVGFEFASQAGVQCSNIGLDTADQDEETKRVFGLIEGRNIESHLLSTRFVANAGTDDMHGQSISWTAPTVLTNGAAAGLLSAYASVALLEGWFATRYAGVPTIHMPRALAALLEVSGLVVWNGDLAYTKNGSKVAMGGGYDVSESDGTWDLFATGEVYIQRAEEIDLNAYVIPGYVAAHESDPNNLTDNSRITLAERMYRVGIDLLVAKTTAQVW